MVRAHRAWAAQDWTADTALGTQALVPSPPHRLQRTQNWSSCWGHSLTPGQPGIKQPLEASQREGTGSGPVASPGQDRAPRLLVLPL